MLPSRRKDYIAAVCVQQKELHMAERLRSGSHLVKLVDACNRCSTVFRIANEHLRDDRFEDFSQRLREILDLFVFELQKESRRNGAAEADPPRTYKLNCDNPALLFVYASSELQNALEGYDLLLANGLSGHSRAMVQRQRQALDILLHDFQLLTVH
jgi:hypothetical protein